MMPTITTRSVEVDGSPAVEVETLSDLVRYAVGDLEIGGDRHRAALQAFIDGRPSLRGCPVEVQPVSANARLWVVMPWPEVYAL